MIGLYQTKFKLTCKLLVHALVHDLDFNTSTKICELMNKLNTQTVQRFVKSLFLNKFATD